MTNVRIKKTHFAQITDIRVYKRQVLVPCRETLYYNYYASYMYAYWSIYTGIKEDRVESDSVCNHTSSQVITKSEDHQAGLLITSMIIKPLLAPECRLV